MKDVGGCEKLRGVANRTLIRMISEWGNPAGVMARYSELNT